MAPSNPTDVEAISRAERLLIEPRSTATLEELASLAARLVDVYDSVVFPAPRDLRDRAARCTAVIAAALPSVRQMVIDNARRYSRDQQIDDAFPYTPNSFQVLGMIRPAPSDVVAFLIEVVRNELGIPRYEAIRASAAIDNRSADMALADLLNGRYRSDDEVYAASVVESAKGSKFVARARGQ